MNNHAKIHFGFTWNCTNELFEISFTIVKDKVQSSRLQFFFLHVHCRAIDFPTLLWISTQQYTDNSQ